jgi:hypothetical protein
MTFFDKKEEVINIELTQYGKHLLSKGKFKPAYYEFFDDDILYDSKFASMEDEKQIDIQTRIKETPRTHVQHTFISSQEEIKKQIEQVRGNEKGSFSDLYVPYNMKHRVAAIPLGKSELGNQNKPAWNIRTFKNKFSETITYITGTYSNIKIPRLKMEDVGYSIRVAEEKSPGYDSKKTNSLTTAQIVSMTSDLNNMSTRFQDNTFLQVEQNYLLLDLQELNTAFEKDNFEIEMYDVSEDNVGIETVKQLYFNKQQESVVNNLLVEDDLKEMQSMKNKPEMVTNYFTIAADREINSTVMCSNLTDEEKRVLNATNQLDIRCDDMYTSLTSPRIVSDVTVDDLGENC